MSAEEEQSKRIDEAFKNVINQIDKDYLRPLQVVMHRCAANCCENRQASLEEVQSCINTCSRVLVKAEEIVKDEFNTVQNRLQRGIMDCRDDMKVQILGTPNEDEMEKFNKAFEKCVINSIDANVNAIPAMVSRLRLRLGELQNKKS